MSEQQKEQRNWIGVSLLVIGIAFLYRKFEFQLFDIPDFLYSWEYIVVLVGAVLLFTGNRSGIGVILVGLFFIFTNDFIHFFVEFRDYWPVVLIIVGVSMLVRSSRKSHQSKLNNGATER